jgi:hypothetical protein
MRSSRARALPPNGQVLVAGGYNGFVANVGGSHTSLDLDSASGARLQLGSVPDFAPGNDEIEILAEAPSMPDRSTDRAASQAFGLAILLVTDAYTEVAVRRRLDDDERNSLAGAERQMVLASNQIGVRCGPESTEYGTYLTAMGRAVDLITREGGETSSMLPKGSRKTPRSRTLQALRRRSLGRDSRQCEGRPRNERATVRPRAPDQRASHRTRGRR